MSLRIRAAESGTLPDWVVRAGIRSLLRQRLREQRAVEDDEAVAHARHREAMRSGPIALLPDTANAQHYEVPADFFATVLGPRLKYSCGLWSEGVETLAAAEEAMLRVTCDRAEVADGMRVLDLGCGWGSWALWAAQGFPQADIVAVSNSAGQRRYIEHEAARQGLGNLTVVTADMNTFEPDGTFDRVVSVEMFEHMRNYERLLSRIGSWLRPAGKLFVHIFCHRRHDYFFEDAGRGDWMARHFFTGGMMPSRRLLFGFEPTMQVEDDWQVNGDHYRRTAEAWLDNLDARRAEVETILASGRGTRSARVEAVRWRLFFLACAELFGYRGGTEWLVSHYLMSPSTSRRRSATEVLSPTRFEYKLS